MPRHNSLKLLYLRHQMQNMKKIYSFFAMLCVVFTLQAQVPADLDQTFDYKDHAPEIITGGLAPSMLVQSDGKIILAGLIQYAMYDVSNIGPLTRILRLNADHTIDNTFNVGTGFNAGQEFDMAIQPDGKILISGNFNSYNGVSVPRLIRLNTDGTRDTTFNFTNGSVGEIKVLPSGKIIVLANITSGGLIPYRLNPNGTLDSTFNIPAAYVNSVLNSVTMQPDGKIVAAGSVYDGAIAANKLIRFNADGSLDTTFSLNMDEQFQDYPPLMLAMQADGKIVACGKFTKYNFITQNGIIRFNSNGTYDPTFVTGTGFAPVFSMPQTVSRIAVTPSGKILANGDLDSYNGQTTKSMVRINTDGTLDTTFDLFSNSDDNGNYDSDDSQVFSVLVDGSIVTLRPTYNSLSLATFYVTHLGVDGALQQNEQLGSSIDGYSILRKSANEIVVIGRAPYRDKKHHKGIKLIDNNGVLVQNTSLFTGFNYLQYAEFTSAVLQPDGKLVVAGSFNSYNGSNSGKIIRLNPDFTIDQTFQTGTGFDFVVEELLRQPDNKILVFGAFTSYNGTPATSIVRLNADGTLDSSFSAGTGAASIACAALMPDGKIVIGGQFNTYNGTASKNVARLNSDGSIDTSFSIGSGFDNAVYSVALQPDGKLIFGGSFINYNGQPAKQMARVNGNGLIDSGFNMSVGFDSTVFTIALQADGKILAGGYFMQVNNLPANHIARLTANGVADEAFSSGTGFDGPVYALFVEDDGKILVTGNFSRYNGAFCTGVVRLLGGDAFVVKGQNRYDLTNNGCSTADPVYPHMKFRVTSGTGETEFIASPTGNFVMPFPAGTYTITPQVEIPSYMNISPATLSVNFPSDASPALQDFCITPNGSHPDLEVTLIPVTVARPGFNSTYKVVYRNKGTGTLSGAVNVSYNDAKMDYVSSIPVFTSQATGSRTWNFSNLNPFETREATVVFNLNSPTETPPVNGGDIIPFTASVTPVAGDERPADNTFVLQQAVVNSLDPNDKRCLEGNAINYVGDYVHYIIRFENTGTYYAENITVHDAIDAAKFDIATLTPISGSHPYITRISGNDVDFIFEGINLPFADASNDGYLVFKIKTRPTLVNSNSFSNSAAIYFDYNPAIITNTATTFVEALSVSDFTFSDYFVLYPNPTDDVLNIYSEQDVELTSVDVYNILGQLVLSITNADRHGAIDVSHLTSGNYLIKVASEKGISVGRFVKR
jgi:uncharacterized delta-60 repeat protein/uncharacterized repeat protein (TIGR01451 family)